MMNRFFHKAILILCCLLALFPAPICAKDALRKEYKIKIALVYNFLRFTEWGDEKKNSKTLVVGVYAQDDVFKLSMSLNGKSAKNRNIVVKRISEKDLINPEKKSFSEYDVVLMTKFRSWDRKVNLKKIIDATKKNHQLFIGEFDRFLEMGGMINFIREKNNVNFEVNLDVVRSANLDINAHMLKCAKRVILTKKP